MSSVWSNYKCRPSNRQLNRQSAPYNFGCNSFWGTECWSRISTIVKSGFHCWKLICCIRMFHKDFCASSKRHTILWTVNILELNSLNSFQKLVLEVPESTRKKLYICLRELETTGPRPVSWRCYMFAKIGTQGVLGLFGGNIGTVIR